MPINRLDPDKIVKKFATVGVLLAGMGLLTWDMIVAYLKFN